MNAKYTENDIWMELSKISRRFTLLGIIANLIGACCVTSYFIFFDPTVELKQLYNIVYAVAILFACLVIIGRFLMIKWLKDLFRFGHLKSQGQEVDFDLEKRAQRKIIDLPFISSMVSLFNWFLAAVTMATYVILDIRADANIAVYLVEWLRVFIGVIIAGIITCAIIFFTTEIKCRHIWPYFFPQGGLARIKGVFRLKLRTRMVVIFILASILPLILMAVLSYNKARLMLTMDPEEVIVSFLYLTGFLLVVTLAVALTLSHLFSTGIIDPVSRMETAMDSVEKGDLEVTVPINSNDELGVLAENFNKMTDGLKERYKLRRSLDLAREVQQNLLPKDNPAVEGLDVAGQSIYCDETGGDYFDFLRNDEPGDSKFAVVIGDVSGHGIPSALLMATGRAFLRQRSALTGGIAEIVSDVNRQLTRDVEETGRFMTLFYLNIDRQTQCLHWVRAGHDPALFYDPLTDSFENLKGAGIALGVDDTCQYIEYTRSGLRAGQVILLGTDGIWEAQNPHGMMFGKELVNKIVRENATADAEEIVNAIMAELTRFRGGYAPEDDTTLIVIKIEKI